MNKNDELKATDWRVKDTQPPIGEFWLAGNLNDKKNKNDEKHNL